MAELVTGEFQQPKTPFDRGGLIKPSCEVDALLGRLGFAFGLEEIEFDTERRHEAVDAAFAYLAGASRLLEMGYPNAEEEVMIAQETSRTLVTLESFFAYTGSERDKAAAAAAVERLMTTDPDIKPTLTHATEKTVFIIEDDKFAASYLQRMLSGNNPIDKWSPVVDWRALEQHGFETVDIPFKVTDSSGRVRYAVHNADINTLQGWSERFEGFAVGAEVDAILGEIAEQLNFLRTLEFRSFDVIEALRQNRDQTRKLAV